MSIYKIKTFTNIWLVGYEIVIESDSNKSLPTIEIVGLPDMSIKESKERIRATFRNLWVELPPRKIILNLAPSDIKKIWTRFDLPMAVAILLLISDSISNFEYVEKSIFFWELWLDWTVKRINGLLPSVIAAYEQWYKYFFVPKENLFELEYIEWINICPVENFKEIIDIFLNWKSIDFIKSWQNLPKLILNNKNGIDFNDIKWHVFAKRALTIAAAWLHNLLMVWPPWSWKTLLSRALGSILPKLDFDEVLEVSQIYSVIWLLDKDTPLLTCRPFRQIHHTASKISIVWWWPYLLPWEISLAHKWILFFDELPEFPSQVMEVLRQPIEDKKIIISRANWNVEYPANFMFVAAMNPCRCWYYKDQEKVCNCSLNEIKRYQSKISWPILDRFDMILEIPRESLDNLLSKHTNESSDQLKEKVINACEYQKKRFINTNIKFNSDMSPKDIDRFVILDNTSEEFLRTAIKSLVLSPRVVHRLLKLSRTIADIDLSDKVKVNHIAEALHYRSKTMFIEN